MSRVLTGAAASRLGSFVIQHGSPRFHAGGEAPAPQAGNDGGPRPQGWEEERLRVQSEAYAQGYEDARRAAEEELGRQRAALEALAHSLDALRPEPTGALALLLAETLDRLVREICGQVEVDAGLLLTRARAAAALIGENVEPSKLRLHPDDAALLAGAELPVPIAPDASLPRGMLRLETGHGWIEDGPQVRLERLRAELDRMAAQA